MTIEQKKKGLEATPGAFEFLSQVTEIWSNDACLGYVILALEELEYPPDQIQEVVNAVRAGFDWTSVDDAARHYQNSAY